MQPRQSKVHDAHVEIIGILEHYIVRLEIPVYHATRVQCRYSSYQLLANRERLVRSNLPSRKRDSTVCPWSRRMLKNKKAGAGSSQRKSS